MGLPSETLNLAATLFPEGLPPDMDMLNPAEAVVPVGLPGSTSACHEVTLVEGVLVVSGQPGWHVVENHIHMIRKVYRTTLYHPLKPNGRICGDALGSRKTVHQAVLYSFAKPSPMHISSSLDLYEVAELLLPLVEHCEW